MQLPATVPNEQALLLSQWLDVRIHESVPSIHVQVQNNCLQPVDMVANVGEVFWLLENSCQEF